jgi:large subunit ribosomal protein L18e
LDPLLINNDLSSVFSLAFLITQLYRYLSKRTKSDFNEAIFKRLNQSRVNRPPLSLSKLALYLKGKKEGRIAVVIGTITDDPRLFTTPKMTVAALRFTRTARRRIVAAGGRCLTLDQLAIERPTGSRTVLLRGPKFARETVKHWGAPGVPGSTAKPYTRKGRSFERARGRRQSRGFKV